MRRGSQLNLEYVLNFFVSPEVFVPIWQHTNSMCIWHHAGVSIHSLYSMETPTLVFDAESSVCRVHQHFFSRRVLEILSAALAAARAQ